MKGLTFKRRQAKDETLARFWCDPELFQQFKDKCNVLGLKQRDVFRDFLTWFIETDEIGIEE